MFIVVADMSGAKDASSGAVMAPQLEIPDAEDDDEADTEDAEGNTINNGSVVSGTRGDRNDYDDDAMMEGSGAENEDPDIEGAMAVDDDDEEDDDVSGDEGNDMEGIRVLEELADNEGSVDSNKDMT
jgi:hypothetical protein